MEINKKGHYRRKFLSSAIAIFLIGTGITSGHSPAHASSEGHWVAKTSTSSHTLMDGQIDIWAPEVQLDPRLRLLAFDDWAQCNVFGNDSWVITSFVGSWGSTSKRLDLKCGSEATMGYLHIRSGHETQWRNRISQTGFTGSTDRWDDFMWGSAELAWRYPDFSSVESYGKVCRSTSIDMFFVDSSGKSVYKYTFWPTFIWSMTNNHLITGYPSSNPGC